MQVGWLWSSLGIGMLLASFCLVWITQGDLSRRLRIIAVALAVGGLAVGALSFLQAPLAAGALIAVIGGSTALFTPLVWTMLQELTPAHLLGRVFTSFATGGMAASMAGMAGFGWAADLLGPGASFVGISILLLMAAGAAGLFSRRNPHAPALAVPKSGPFPTQPGAAYS